MAATTSDPISTAIAATDKCFIRPYVFSDVEPIAAAGNHPAISAYMRNTFPFPYTLESSSQWIGSCMKDDPMVNFAICTPEGQPCGGIGLIPRKDVEYRTWEVGYWVGTEHWGKGIATSALRAFSIWALKAFPELLRLEAGVFGGNNASMKVLERAGYTKEGVRRKAICKKGEVMDQVVFGLIREDLEGLE
ncbi:acyl-CoA N-acyltransferase [Hypoxylon sp. NC1633]|nr:acyl-CoA N-acyltransferase [Hypoxylon sp. NC1633]